MGCSFSIFSGWHTTGFDLFDHNGDGAISGRLFLLLLPLPCHDVFRQFCTLVYETSSFGDMRDPMGDDVVFFFLLKNFFSYFFLTQHSSLFLVVIFGLLLSFTCSWYARLSSFFFFFFFIFSLVPTSGADVIHMLSTVVRLNSTTLGTRSDVNLFDIVRPQLKRLGKNLNEENISFVDFKIIVRAHPFIVSLMELNVEVEGRAKSGAKGSGGSDNGGCSGSPRANIGKRRRTETAGF